MLWVVELELHQDFKLSMFYDFNVELQLTGLSSLSDLVGFEVPGVCPLPLGSQLLGTIQC